MKHFYKKYFILFILFSSPLRVENSGIPGVKKSETAKPAKNCVQYYRFRRIINSGKSTDLVSALSKLVKIFI